MAIFRGPTFLMVTLLVIAAGCGEEAKDEKPATESVREQAPARSINEVLIANVDRLMALDEVQKVAVGTFEDGTPCIEIHVKYKSDVLAEEIGVEMEGHPVNYIVSGEERPSP